MRKCDNCRFFRDNPTHCRRFPPTVRDDNRVAFPMVKPAWVCGEHRLSLRRLLKRKPKLEMDQG